VPFFSLLPNKWNTFNLTHILNLKNVPQKLKKKKFLLWHH